MNNNVDLKNVAYEGASMYGKFNALMCCISGTICICCIYTIAYLLYNNAKKYTQNTTSTITSANCLYNKSPKGVVTYHCNLVVSYTINNVNYSNKIIVDSSKNYNINDVLKIKYNESNPNEIIEDNPLTNASSNPITAYGLCICALCMCIILYAYTWFVFTNKNFAAATGALSAVDTMVN
jgi:hypothetical protein